jgi:hypothetical protein
MSSKLFVFENGHFQFFPQITIGRRNFPRMEQKLEVFHGTNARSLLSSVAENFLLIKNVLC